MQKGLLAIFLVFSSLVLHAQQVTNIFPGTWQYDNGNQRFIVKIWHQNSMYYGHYKMVQLNNGIPGNTIFDSRQVYPNGAQFSSTIYTKAYSNIELSGFIDDNTIIGNDEDFKTGDLQITLNQIPGCLTCTPFTATWKVTKTHGAIVGLNLPFSVPTDIVLTKVSDTVTWD